MANAHVHELRIGWKCPKMSWKPIRRHVPLLSRTSFSFPFSPIVSSCEWCDLFAQINSREMCVRSAPPDIPFARMCCIRDATCRRGESKSKSSTSGQKRAQLIWWNRKYVDAKLLRRQLTESTPSVVFPFPAACDSCPTICLANYGNDSRFTIKQIRETIIETIFEIDFRKSSRVYSIFNDNEPVSSP